jgi:SAM-dependent methyltransferase
MFERFLAGQFARPHGIAGRLLLGSLLERIGAPMMEAAFAALDASPGDRVLDLGFGGGALTRRLLAVGAIVEGVDRSAVMVARACRRHAAAVAQGKARFQVGSADKIPLADGAIDRAASVNTLYFWPDLAPVLLELRRVLRPGGRLVLCYQEAASVRAWPGHVHGFTAHDDGTADAALSAAGFRAEAESRGQHARVGHWRCLAATRIDQPSR